MNANTVSTGANAVLTRRSSLGTIAGRDPHVVADLQSVRIIEEPFLDLTSLRISRKADVKSIAAPLGLDLLMTPNTFVGDIGHSIGRYEPNAWMMISGKAPSIASNGALLATNLSARLIAFRLSGDNAERILLSSTPVIPQTSGFVRTLFAETYAVIIQRLGGSDFRLLVDVSLAQAMADWLSDAARLSNTSS